MKLRILPALIAALLLTASAQAATPAPPAPAARAATPASSAQPEATQAEIDRLVERIRELARQLGKDARVQIEIGRHGDMMSGPHGDREVRIQRYRDDAMAATMPARVGIGIVMAPSAAASGVRIAAVTPDGPAAKGGLRSGDVLVSVDGKPIAASGSEAIAKTRDLLGDLKPGQAIKLGYAREGKTGVVTVKADNIRQVMAFSGDGLAPMMPMTPMPGVPPMPPAPPMPPMSPHDMQELHALRIAAPGIDSEIERMGPMLACAPGKDDCDLPVLFEAFRWQGLNLASIDAQLGRYFGTDHGALVLSPGPDLKTLQAGDVIQRVAGGEVKTPRDVMRALRDKDTGSTLKLDVLRDRKPLALEVTVPQAQPLPFLPPPPAPPAPPAPPRPPNAPRTPEAAPSAPPAPPRPPAVAFIDDVGNAVEMTVQDQDDAGDGQRIERIVVVAPARDDAQH